MKTIWKYHIDIAPVVIVEMPKGAKILPHVDIVSQDKDLLVFWAEVDDEQPKEDRIFRIFGTGHEMPADKRLDYIATVRLRYLVLHVYEQPIEAQLGEES